MVKKFIVTLYCLIGISFATGIHADSADQPDLEFLEFLADWQSDQGEWLDPLHMQELAQNEPGVQSTEVQGDE
ncbi:MAG: hypothetical protein OQK70_07800 [Gammaproteobacteria bacterium]|nr:hypothetical protein [Gammaproteobacteria bacterium]